MARRVLCVCKGNSDRSPMMAAVLAMYLKNAGITDVTCESGGIFEAADRGGASLFAVRAARRIGIDLSGHKRRRLAKIGDLANLNFFDLIICVDEEVAARVLELGAEIERIFNAQIPNQWPVHFQQDYDLTAERIMAAMFGVVTRYFPQG